MPMRVCLHYTLYRGTGDRFETNRKMLCNSAKSRTLPLCRRFLLWVRNLSGFAPGPLSLAVYAMRAFKECLLVSGLHEGEMNSTE
jgi:hypothetical protein